MKLSEEISEIIQNKQYVATRHFYDKIKKEKLKELLDDKVLEQVILEGQMIERLQWYNNGEKSIIYCEYNQKKFHVVLRYNHGTLKLVTIYSPNSTFGDDKKTRLDVNK